MIIPIRCFTCNKVIAHLNYAKKLVNAGKQKNSLKYEEISETIDTYISNTIASMECSLIAQGLSGSGRIMGWRNLTGPPEPFNITCIRHRTPEVLETTAFSAS